MSGQITWAVLLALAAAMAIHAARGKNELAATVALLVDPAVLHDQARTEACMREIAAQATRLSMTPALPPHPAHRDAPRQDCRDAQPTTPP